jgi:hypothetical protein
VPTLTGRWTPILTLASLLGGAGASACSSANCDRNPSDPPVRVTEGTVKNGVYQSAPWNGPFLDFPPGRTYRFVHGLGSVPRFVQPYLAFPPMCGPEAHGQGGELTPGTGNQTMIKVTTVDYVDVRNDTCADVCLMLVAGGAGAAPSDDAGTSDASAP